VGDVNRLSFPQAGIITSLDARKARAKVHIPLLGLETGWIPVATGLFYEERVQMEGPVITADPSGTIERPPKEDPPPPYTFTRINGQAGTVERLSYGTLRVGDEVVVVFLNGDINSGVVIARL
jgi:phage baseplate assembly protein gpV